MPCLESWGLEATDILRLSPPGSRHLRGLAFGIAALNELGRTGSAAWLFRPPGEPSAAAWAYIAAGEAAGVHTAYKCHVRKPWWRVPNLAPADLLLTYMNADTPRLTTNTAKAAYLNSVHGVYLAPKLRKALLPLTSLTSMTLVGAQTVGRAYGGGMLKLEPREADRLPVPPAAVVEAAADRPTNIRPQVAALLRTGKLLEASKLVDDVLLVGERGWRAPRSKCCVMPTPNSPPAGSRGVAVARIDDLLIGAIKAAGPKLPDDAPQCQKNPWGRQLLPTYYDSERTDVLVGMLVV